MTDRMFSPWRSEYVAAAADRPVPSEGEASLFAHLEAEQQDEENLILWRGEHVFVIMNRYPYNNGHLLIVPYREVAAYEDLRPAEQMALARTIERCIRWLRHALDPEGFNVGLNLGEASGAGVPEHLHMHVVPRWGGDTNFMTTTGDMRVIPEALRVTYRKLSAAIEAVGALPTGDESDAA
jgi:ATP adenylyltransferase